MNLNCHRPYVPKQTHSDTTIRDSTDGKHVPKETGSIEIAAMLPKVWLHSKATDLAFYNFSYSKSGAQDSG